ncbi:TPA: hypothetical protein ACJSAI_001158 [Streptococcus agalactiae]
MNSVIFCFEGANDVGKSTLLKKLSNNSLCQNFELGTTEKLQDYEWWFHNSSPYELIDEIIGLVTKREKGICSFCESKVCLVDKGYMTLFSRLKATFLLRGIVPNELSKYMDYFTEKYINRSAYNIKEILLLPKMSDNNLKSEDVFFSPLVKSSATSSLITRVPEVKLFGLAQTKYLRFYTFEFV